MLIKDGFVLAPDHGTAELCTADIRVRNRKIEQIAPSLAAEPGEEIVDAKGKLVLPGMINAHYHSYSNIVKGTLWGEPLEIWASDTIALGGCLDDSLMAASAKLGIVEMLRAGVTACLDHIPHLPRVDAIAQVYHETGFRAALAPMIADLGDDRVLCDLAEDPAAAAHSEKPQDFYDTLKARYDGWVSRWHDPEGTLQMVCGINSPQRASDRALRTAADIANKYDLGVHAHLLETRWQADSAAAIDDDLLEKMQSLGLLHARTGLAHCVWLTEEDHKRIAKAGSTVVHNPTSNLFLGSGRADITAMTERGVRVALGTDGSNCATGQNLLMVLRTAILLSRHEESDYRRWLAPQQCWNMATKNGAAVCGWDGEIGILQEGARADIVLADCSDIIFAPINDLAVQVMTLLDRLDVTDVFVDGAAMMRNGTILSLDEDALLSEMRERSAALRTQFHEVLAESKQAKAPFEQVYRTRMRKDLQK